MAIFDNSPDLPLALTREIVNEAGVGLWSLDPHEDRCLWDAQMYAIHGRPLDLGPPTRDAWLSLIADVGDAVRLIKELFGTGAAQGHVECRIAGPDGTTRWVAYRIRHYEIDGQKRVAGLCMAASDSIASPAGDAPHAAPPTSAAMSPSMSPAKETADSFAQVTVSTPVIIRPTDPPDPFGLDAALTINPGPSSPSQGTLAPAQLGFALWERDLRTNSTYWDSQMYRLRGLDADDSRTPAELLFATMHPDDRDAARNQLDTCLHSRSGTDHFFRVVWPDGSIHRLGARLKVEEGTHGRPIRMLGMQWACAPEQLDAPPSEAWATLARATRAKSQFLARVSHDMRTPLNAVLGFSQLITSDSASTLSPRQRQLLRHIRAAGEHLLALVDDVRDLTNIEAGTMSCHLEVVPLAPIVTEAMKWIAQVAAQAHVQPRSTTVRGLVMADPTRLRQVLINLLSNAIKYNRPHGTVEVGLVHNDDGSQIGIEVSDTGRGMSAAQMAQLFQPYNRLGVESDGVDGTGLGLTISRHLVDRMGGRLEVESQVGVGSRFTLWLHAAEQPASLTRAAALLGAESAALAVAHQVVCIEDDPLCRMLIENLATLRGTLAFHVAADGFSGIEAAHRLLPQVILVDLTLPDTDGFDVLRRLKADASLADATIVALSASRMPSDIERAQREGFAGYWVKPIVADRFLDSIDVLAARNGAAPLDFGSLSRMHPA